MAGIDLERLAIQEIIAEIEKRKRQELLLSSQPSRERQVRPNKRFLGRTIVSVLQHNQRQSREEKQNSNRKLNELNKRRRVSARRISETLNERKISPKPHDKDDFDRQLRLEMCFLGKVSHLTNDPENAPKKEKMHIKESFPTIDLTKKKKKSAKQKKKKKKHKIRRKKIKSKKRRRRKDSSSSSSSSSSDSSSSSCSSTNSITMLELSLTPTIELT